VSDVTNTGRFSPDTFDAEWLDGASGPSLGARFRGHVKRNEMGAVYGTRHSMPLADHLRGSVLITASPIRPPLLRRRQGGELRPRPWWS
jgi:hypothetical protein